MSSNRRPAAWAAAIGLASLAACRMDMQDQPRYEAYEQSAFFADGATMRPTPPDSLPRARGDEYPLAFAGRERLDPRPPPARPPSEPPPGDEVPPDVANATTAPIPITREVLDRGQDLFETYCAACHGLTGEGDGMVARRGFRTPPAYHVQRLREAPIGHFVDVITNGWGAMPTYGYLVRPRDRWAVAAYIRTLQLSRAVPLDTLPRGVRETLAGVPPPPPPQPQPPSRPPGQEPR